MTLETLVTILAGIVGLLVGSFLNVCIVRLPANLSVVRPRSRCPRCERPIAWYDNIPVLSWLVLRGKCRGCGLPISPMYPAVELLTACIWALMAWCYPLDLEALRGAVFFTLLLGIAVTDAREYIIPHEFSIGGMVIGLLFALGGGIAVLLQAMLGAVTGFGLIWIIGVVGTRIARKEAMGGGDMWMMGMVGAFLGWQSVLLTIFLGSLLGTIIFLPLNLIGPKKDVPFGVFLAMGAAATWIAGAAMIAWYRSYIGL
ncbi:MAG TPA: prepilin peptidase [Gemmatimonadales bacterium]|nr:prepilin peptidase [Gemmatimonadales bacterium]